MAKSKNNYNKVQWQKTQSSNFGSLKNIKFHLTMVSNQQQTTIIRLAVTPHRPARCPVGVFAAHIVDLYSPTFDKMQ